MIRLAATLGVHGQAKSSLREETEIEDAMNSCLLLSVAVMLYGSEGF